jgi:hypothetical protein
LKETGVGTDDTCPQGSLSLLDHKVEVAVKINAKQGTNSKQVVR